VSTHPQPPVDTPVDAPIEVDAVVLVGGQGTRLRPLTLSAAKPMLPTAGVPFLEHLLSRIHQVGIRHVVLGTSYKAETFTEYFGDGSAAGLDIEYLVEDEPLGTGGAIRNVGGTLRADTVMVFNGDILSGLDLSTLLATHHENNADVTLHLVKVADPRAFGSVPTDPDGRVQAFLEKTDNPPTDQINAGCYVFRRSVLESIPAGRPGGVGGAGDLPRAAGRGCAGVRPRRRVVLAGPGHSRRVRARIVRPGDGDRPDRRIARPRRPRAGAARRLRGGRCDRLRRQHDRSGRRGRPGRRGRRRGGFLMAR